MTLHDTKLATGPVSWGVDFAEAADNPRWQEVLDDIARSGVGALELGPVGYLPEDPASLKEALAGRGLTAVGSFVFEDLHDARVRDDVVGIARRACRAINAADGTVLVIIDRPGPQRAATAGRSDIAPRLASRAWRTMIALIERLAELARKDGLEPAFHPHAGSFVEFPDEIDRLVDDTDIGLCLDTGHLTYAGLPAHDAITIYGPRIVHMHLKDTDPDVLDRVRRERLAFWDAIGLGVFCPLGQGEVDLPLVASALERISYSGFATIEQDRVPGSGHPLDDLKQSLDVLALAGIGSPGLKAKRA